MQVKQNTDRIFSNDHRKREIVKQEFIQLGVHPSVHVAEVFSSPRTARLVHRFGLPPGFAFDLQTGWDLNDPAQRMKMWSHLQHERFRGPNLMETTCKLLMTRTNMRSPGQTVRINPCVQVTHESCSPSLSANQVCVCDTSHLMHPQHGSGAVIASRNTGILTCCLVERRAPRKCVGERKSSRSREHNSTLTAILCQCKSV